MTPNVANIFDRVYLGTQTGTVRTWSSRSIPVKCPGVHLAMCVMYGSGSAGNDPALALSLEGSYDRRVWKTTGLSSASCTALLDVTIPPYFVYGSKIATDYAFLRVRATCSELLQLGSVRVLFVASLVLSP